MTIVLALLFGLVGLLVILFIVKAVFGPLFYSLSGWRERSRFSACRNYFKALDSLADSSQIAEIRSAAGRAFYLDIVKKNPGILETIYNHNLAVLGKIIQICGDSAGPIKSLPVLEDLLRTRRQLNRVYFEKLALKQKLNKKKTSASTKKEPPEWAKQEFNKQIKDILDKLQTNRSSIASQLEALFKEFSAAGSGSDVTYH
ncbi:MAG: hypothetical protein D6719_09010 [Candidatus Dadabacteria bacterium]|nr:MAG: hypothetical protein D6719_09010 [Candidatus Dadabacteria bacterium]